MKPISSTCIFPSLFAAAAIVSASSPQDAAGNPAGSPEPINEWLFASMVAWDDNIDKHHRVAKALGYYAVGEGREFESTHEFSRDMHFYLNDPHKNVQPDTSVAASGPELERLQAAYPFTFARYPELPRAIDMNEIANMRENDPEVFTTIKADFERTKAWSTTPNRAFPNNLAQLQTWGAEALRWEPAPDFQQQDVIEAHIASIVRYLQTEGEKPEQNYLFKGIVIDVVEIWDEFDWNSRRGIPGEPNIQRYTPERPGITHEYATYAEGWIQFLAQLRDALEAAYPERDIKFIWEPTPMYEKWVQYLNPEDYPSITPEILEKAEGDALIAEKPGLQYLEDPRFQEKGWSLQELGTATGDLFTKEPYYPLQLKYFGEITARGAWFLSYGTFDRSRADIDTYEPQFTLIRSLSGWENFRATPTEDRIWDDAQQIYLSPHVYADSHVLAGHHPRDGKLYAVFLDEAAKLPLSPKVAIGGLQSVNAYWEPTGDLSAELLREGDYARLDGYEGDYPVGMILEPAAEVAHYFAQPADLELNEILNEANLIISGIINPDAEEGVVGWKTAREARISSVTEPVQSGERALKIDRRGAVWHGAMIGIDGYMMSQMQGDYTFSIQVMPETTVDTFTLSLHFHDGGTKRSVELGEVTAQPGEWTELKATAELDWQDWVSESRLTIRRMDKTEPFYVDNFQATAER